MYAIRSYYVFQLEQVVLGVDEYEALRLVDLEGLQQEDAAKRMKVSRATCARRITSYNVCYTKLLRTPPRLEHRRTVGSEAPNR